MNEIEWLILWGCLIETEPCLYWLESDCIWDKRHLLVRLLGQPHNVSPNSTVHQIFMANHPVDFVCMIVARWSVCACFGLFFICWWISKSRRLYYMYTAVSWSLPPKHYISPRHKLSIKVPARFQFVTTTVQGGHWNLLATVPVGVSTFRLSNDQVSSMYSIGWNNMMLNTYQWATAFLFIFPVVRTK